MCTLSCFNSSQLNFDLLMKQSKYFLVNGKILSIIIFEKDEIKFEKNFINFSYEEYESLHVKLSKFI